MAKMLKNLCEDKVVFHDTYSKNRIVATPRPTMGDLVDFHNGNHPHCHTANRGQSSPALRAQSDLIIFATTGARSASAIRARSALINSAITGARSAPSKGARSAPFDS